MTLTAKKKAFADAVLGGSSNKAAAIGAGYSEATASPAGSRLAKDKDVLAYLKKLRSAAKAGAPNGVKTPDAAPDWPFGTESPSDAKPATEPAAPPAPAAQMTGEEYLRKVVNDEKSDDRLRLEAAKKLIDFEKSKPAPMGKKETRLADAKKVGQTSRFAAAAPPKLAAANGKRV